MNRSAQDHRFSLFPVICSQLPVTRSPDNSNLFLFPLKVLVIGSQLYYYVSMLVTDIFFVLEVTKTKSIPKCLYVSFVANFLVHAVNIQIYLDLT